MTSLQLTDNLFPQLHLQDTVDSALQLMIEFKATHLPVVSDDTFLGLISEEDLINEENKNATIGFFQSSFVPGAVNSNNHFLKAATVCNLYHTNVIPVTGENNELMGTISAEALITALGNFCGSAEFGAVVVLEIERIRFTLSEINSIVESDGASILHFNVSPHPSSDLLEITLQINKKEVSMIIATFERYDYSVSFYSGEELFENEINTNYNNLIKYLNI